MEHRGGLAAVGEIHWRAHGGAGLGIHHRHPHTVIAGRPEVGGGALVHVPAAAVKVALPGSENLCRTQAEQERGGTEEGIKAFQTISHSNLFKCRKPVIGVFSVCWCIKGGVAKSSN